MPIRRPNGRKAPSRDRFQPPPRPHMLASNVIHNVQLLLIVLFSSGWSNHQPCLVTAARPLSSVCTAQQDIQCASSGTKCVNGTCLQPIVPDVETAVSISCSRSSECRQRHLRTPFCVEGRCVAKCTSSADCHGPNAKICAVDGICRQAQCRRSSQCKAADAATPYCLAGNCSKTQCVDNTHCTGAAAYCVRSRCRRQQCFQDAHCVEQLGQGYTCNNGSCQAAAQQICAQDVDCSSSTTPYCVNSTCQPSQCTSNADCSSLNNGSTPFCVLSGSISTCQACSTDVQCRQSSPINQFCRNITGQKKCVGCAQDADCSNNLQYSGTVCDATSGSCVQCTTNQHCNFYTVVPGELTCTEFKCVSNNSSEAVNVTQACTNSTQCPRWPYGAIQTCQMDTAGMDGYCRECQQDSDCPAGLNGVNATCSPSGQCLQCTGSSDCPSTTWEPAVCSAAVGKCVECQTDEHCRFRLSPAKLLLCFHGICSYCRSDSDCCGWAGQTGQGPYCDAQGKCNVRGRSCKQDDDCTYILDDNRCMCAQPPCPKPMCLGGICDSGLQGL